MVLKAFVQGRSETEVVMVSKGNVSSSLERDLNTDQGRPPSASRFPPLTTLH